ncbi:MAG: hypothetical protein K5895_10075 [Lachnospiraceae bacterium]|jgi:hypothetical protein|nr:hypothetical protein [Lachnospiraceae bacterium]
MNSQCYSYNPESVSIDQCVFPHTISPLSTVTSHYNVECIERYFNKDFPYYVAIHKINNADFPQVYTEPHCHPSSEINVLISEDENFKYEIMIGDETKIVGGNVSIYIPPNVMHSTNVLCGNGYYIAIRLEEQKVYSSVKNNHAQTER